MSYNTTQTYIGDGVTVLFTFNFPSVDYESNICVDINGDKDSSGFPWLFANSQTIEFVTAPPTGTKIEIYRDSSTDEMAYTFYPGSAIRAKDLNENFSQILYGLQELEDFAENLSIDDLNPEGFITQAEVEAGVNYDYWTDDRIATAAAIRGLQNVYESQEPPEKVYRGKLWFQPAPIGSDQYLRMWTGSGWTIISTTVSGSTPFEPKEVIFVNNKGNDGNAGTSPRNAVRTISKALSIANRESTKPATDINTASYDQVLGEVEVTTARPHGIVQGNSVELSPMRWTCSNGTKNYPPVATAYVVQRVVDESRFVVYVGPFNQAHTYVANQSPTPEAQPLDTFSGDGKIISVAAGIYAEELPLQMKAKNLSIIGNSLRNTYVHPAVPNDNSYDPFNPANDSNELKVMFEMTSGSYITGVTMAGMKAKGPRGGYALDDDDVYGLPTRQGWIAAFLGETNKDESPIITKSPYIQNCTNFADNSIDNRLLSATDYNNGTGFNPDFLGGEGGDITSAPTGGGMLVNGATPASTSPLRSFVVDSFTQIALDGPGILATNLAYSQLVSFFGTFCSYHAKAKNGSILNLSNCTTDFGRYGLIADGKSTLPIFTGRVKKDVSKGKRGNRQEIVAVGDAVYDDSDGSLEITPATPLTTGVSTGTLVKIQFLAFTKPGNPEISIPETYSREYAVVSGNSKKFKITIGSQELSGYTYTADSGDLLVPTGGSKGPKPSTVITIDNLGNQSTDWAAPRATTPGSTMLMRTGVGSDEDPYIFYPIVDATPNTDQSEYVVTVFSPLNNFNKSNLGFVDDVSAGETVSFFLQSYISTGGHTMEYVGSGCDYRSHPDYGGVAKELNQTVELGGEVTPASLTPYNSGRIWLSSTDQDGKFKVGSTFSVDQKTGQIFIDPSVIVQPPLSVIDNLDVGPWSIYTSFGTNTNIQIAPKGTGSLIIGNNGTVNTDGSAPTNPSTNSIMGPLKERNIETDEFGEVYLDKEFPVVTQRDIGYDANEVPIGGLLGQLAYTDTAPSVAISNSVPLPNEVKFTVNASNELFITYTKPNGQTLTSEAISLS